MAWINEDRGWNLCLHEFLVLVLVRVNRLQATAGSEPSHSLREAGKLRFVFCVCLAFFATFSNFAYQVLLPILKAPIMGAFSIGAGNRGVQNLCLRYSTA